MKSLAHGKAVGVAAFAYADILEPVLVVYVGARQWSRRANGDGLFFIPTDDGGVWLCFFW